MDDSDGSSRGILSGELDSVHKSLVGNGDQDDCVKGGSSEQVRCFAAAERKGD